jgi:hypothetical protein
MRGPGFVDYGGHDANRVLGVPPAPPVIPAPRPIVEPAYVAPVGNKQPVFNQGLRGLQTNLDKDPTRMFNPNR